LFNLKLGSKKWKIQPIKYWSGLTL
jgi:hypothetical protein